MSQHEVYEFLKQHQQDWFTAKEIAESASISQNAAIMSLKKLRNSKLVAHRTEKKTYQYKFKEN
jgi:DNA-binding IscR family transcriptional regulator